MTTYCLNMIVKNEQRVVARCLNSALPYCEEACVTDTGSTDRTADVLRLIGALNGREVAVHFDAWQNFAVNRNWSLGYARRGSPSDYILLLDADHELVIPNLEAWQSFKPIDPAYRLWQDHGTLRYANTRLLRRGAPARYVGVTHEVLGVEGTEVGWSTPATLPYDLIHVVDHADGGNRADKFQRDIDLLLADYRSSHLPNPRTVFYLAQSYRDAGKLDDAARWYAHRALMEGWEEEGWYASYQRAVMVDRIGEHNPVEYYLKAYERRPWRAEPLASLALFCGGTNRAHAANIFRQHAGRLPWPTGDVLFIERELYPEPDPWAGEEDD